MKDELVANLLLAQKILDSNPKPENWIGKCWALVDSVLLDNPDNALGVMIAANLHMEKGADVIAYHLAHRAVDLAPEKALTWNTLGRACKAVYNLDGAEACFKKSLELAKLPEDISTNTSNLAAILIDSGKFREAEPICRQAIEMNPEGTKAKANLALSLLAQRRWKEGWENYSASFPTPWRMPKPFKDEPVWDGTKGKRVLFYSEQGLGDEISFAQMLRDAAKDCANSVFECSPKLEGLFRRSFGDVVKVYGSRPIPERPKQRRDIWDEVDAAAFDYSVPMGGLGAFYRNTDESFDRKPYLVADPDRVQMWKSLFESKGKPVIGIAWSGGASKTGMRVRKFRLEDMLPIFRAIDAHWVCLQYTDASDELKKFKEEHGVEVTQYPWATLTQDYDDTAALVAALDMVVAMQTAVIHLAGALGVPQKVILPVNSQWRYGEQEFTDMLWYPENTKLYRQKQPGDWAAVFARISRELKAAFGAAKAA